MQFSFERRRYARSGKGCIFTWAFVKYNDKWLSLGDPWPGVNWKRSELERFGKIAIEEAQKAEV